MCARDLSFVIHPASKSAEKAYYVPRGAQNVSLSLMPSLDRTAIETQCRALFWDLYLPHGIAEARDGMLQKCNHPPNWTSILLELPHDEPALELAFSALSISRVGRSNHDIRLVKESTKVYGRALKDLQRALTDKSRTQTEEVLAACSLLGLYEVFESGDTFNKSVGWISHAQGAARLIELRGPSKHITRQSHHVFLGARLPILYSAIVRRKRTFLAREDWLTVPWTTVPVKTYHDILVDHVTRIPGFLEDFDKLRETAHHPRTRISLHELLQACHALKDVLTKWEHGKKQLSRPVVIQHEQQKDDPYPFDHEMSWENHLFMNASLVYWSAQLVLSVTVCQIELLLGSIGFPRANMHVETTSSSQQAHQFATCIAQSVPYALMPDMGALGINHITFPMCLAFQHFVESKDEKTCSWLIKKCNDMKQQGIRIRAFDEPTLVEKQRDKWYPGNPSEHSENDKVTGVASVNTETSDGESDWPLSPSSAISGRSFKSTFIFENPAKYYLDTTDSG
ncbi:hypothetical protein H2198_010766 [Neophaeococcomyces mojaviensis]|uniref:Uncharacterized protein n=1 Tax=Neophaeococcomyces mojaviensis TaxID=3383035 RepID=A0ACC2ZQN3_9EURO|nr:hypothetical protein H2198_010766 [Knufia sp. JES_112]